MACSLLAVNGDLIFFPVDIRPLQSDQFAGNPYTAKPCQSYDQTPFSIRAGIDYLVDFFKRYEVISIAISSCGALKIAKGIAGSPPHDKLSKI